MANAPEPAAAHTPRTYRERGWWRDTTIIDDLRAAVARHPGKPAVVGYHASGDPVETLTYARLAELAERAAGGLLALGVRRGDTVSLQLPNWWQFTVLCLACARVGAVAHPVLPIMRRREVSFMARRTGARVHVAPAEWNGFSYARMLDEVRAEAPGLEHLVLIGGDGTVPAVDFDVHFLDTPWEEKYDLAGHGAHPDDPAQVMFTSGTTGEPKGVLHSHNTLYALTRAEAEPLELTGDDVITMGSPMTHQAGYAYCMLMPLLLGATAVYLDAWDPALMLRLVEEQRATFAMGATTFLVDAIEEQRRAPRDLSSLRIFACGGSPIPPAVVERAREVLDVRVHALWGMTENGTVTITRPGDPPDRAAVSDGTPVEWMQVRIVDDHDRPVPPGATGRLQVRGASQCLGYLGRDDLYAAALAPGGWFDSGDLARDDGFGGIRIAGRIKDIVVRGGEKVPVVEVEAALLRHPAVREVAVVGYPDDRLGERACAIVVPDGPAPELADLTGHLASLGMAKQYWPERLVVRDALPKTPSGKIQKFLLRDEITEA
ncbi:AMP-binding protein [Thermomonospora cellulosilytica]|uniref:Cyclohexanecarboxylate-CoA ligase n=1 Tax=Thermomonospora cellulosilytica TaxID=1411118 RepID=A0A7W3N0L3_9ACTN|nr:AMP-binding protein [Thermomonospora cellulosilytica]MBA9005257.1 cyclohexanecarboxylate-CoA ligase [Thermomonospora cellulosilytica]